MLVFNDWKEGHVKLHYANTLGFKYHTQNIHHPLVISLTSTEHQTHIHGAALNALNSSIESIEKRKINSKK